jgi:putative spermidine/putrescine transport system substrate-binding protein/spermidine/putrescine transport system substrate-binding protein
LVQDAPLTRRRWLALALACAALSGFAGVASAEEKVLRIIGWEGYMDESFAKAFTEKTGYKIVATYAGSSDEMYAKIKAGGGSTYDMVTASGDLTKRLYDSGLLEKVDLAKVPNYAKLFPLFKAPAYNTFGDSAYGVSIAWGPDFLIYDSSVVKTPPESWQILYDPAYANKVSLNDYAIIIADVALWLGKPNIYELSSKDLAEIKPKLMALKPAVRKFWTSQGELAQLFLNKEIVMAWGWPVTIQQLKKEGFPVAATIPKEGATGWSDSWMIIKGSPNAEAAHAWMNYMLEGEPQKQMTTVSGYWPVSSLIEPLLSADERKDMHIDDLDQYYGKIHFWETVQNYDEWTALWNEFRGQ